MGAEAGYAAGFELTWYLLTNSLATYPQDVVIEEGVSNFFDDVIQKIKNNKYFQRKVNEVLQNKTSSFEKEIIKEFSFGESGNFDLEAAINKYNVLVSGEKNEDGTWNLEIEITDEYDFTEFVNPFIKEITEENNEGEVITYEKWANFSYAFSWLANDAAYLSQSWGAITPFKVKILFTMRNYKAE